jgi:hypothetical protein
VKRKAKKNEGKKQTQIQNVVTMPQNAGTPFVIRRQPMTLSRALGSTAVVTRGLIESVTFTAHKKRAA